MGSVGDDAEEVSTVGEAARMVWEESKRLWGIGTPIAIATLSMYAVSSVTTIFVGHLGNLPLAAASIGLSVFSTFSLGFLLGMGSALETLCGQAFGAGQVAMLGVYLQRSWIVLIAAALLMVPFYVFAEPLLLAIGQDPVVAREAARFALYILPGAFSFAVNFPTAKFLQAQSKVLVLAWIGVAGLCFHVALTYLLVTVLGWGSAGAAVAYDLSLWAIALGQAAYIIGWCKDGWRGWSMAAFNEMWAFVRLSLESAVMLCLEIWYLGMITVLTGDLQDAQIAVDSLGICAVPPLPPLPRSCASWGRWIPSTTSPFSSREGPGWRRGTSERAVHPAMARPPILSVALPSDTGRVLSIQSHTVQGYVGNKSAVFPLQLLGFDVDPINSVQFSNHTGYPKFRGQVLNGNQLWDLIEGLEENELLHYTHLLTGYIGSVSFLNTVLQVVDKLRSVNPNLIYVCDPVLGDEGKLYVPQDLVSVYQEKVVPVASMLTPNQFEVELLTGLRITSEQDGLKACNTLHTAGPRKVIITSALIEDKLLLIGSYKRTEEQPPEQFKIEIPKIPAYFTGTGDLTTALLLGWSNKYPDNLEKAAELAVSSLQALLRRTVEDYRRAGFDPSSSSLEIRLIQSQDEIRNPQVTCNAVKYK